MNFLDPNKSIDVEMGKLPHWQQGSAFCFVTWRLSDALPKGVLSKWRKERDLWLESHPQPWIEKFRKEYHERFTRQIESKLDQGSGACVLKEHSKIVSDAFLFQDGEKYRLESFVVMPNHVHVLFQPLGDERIGDIIRRWKSFTSREINRNLGKSGALWQREYWDRLVRHERQFFKIREYIRENPIKAHLREGEFFLWEK